MTDSSPKTPRRWGRIILVISLAFNLLIVGLVAGAMLGGPRDRDRNPLLRDIGFGTFVQALTRADKHAMTEALKRDAGSFRENRTKLRHQFDEFLNALRADPFDPAEVSRLMVQQRSRIGERQQLGQTLLLERIEAMSLEDRRAYADSLSKMLKRRGKPRR